MAKKSTKKKYNYVTRTMTLPDGTRKYVYGKTKAEAEQKLAELKAQVAGGVVVNDDTTFGELAKLWIENYRMPYYRINTIKNNRSQVNKWLMPRLAGIPVKDITPLQIQAVVSDMLNSGYTQAYAVVKTMRDIFDVAVDIGCIAKSPIPKSFKAPPRPEHKKKQLMTREMEANILKHLKPLSRERLFLQCGLHLGCRRGEIYGLCWENIDLENGIIYIRRQVIHDDHGHAVVEEVLKTASGKRELPISPTLHKELTLWGEWYGKKGFVFAYEDGRPLDLGAVNWTWGNIRKAAHKYDPKYAEEMTAHVLRHTFITRLFEAGLDIKEIQTLAGHKDVSTTLGVYTHFDKEVRQQSTFTKVRSILESEPSQDTPKEEPKKTEQATVIHLALPQVVNH